MRKFRSVTCFAVGLVWVLAGGLGAAASPGSASELPGSVAGQDLGTRREIALDLRSAPKASVVVFLSARCPCSASHEGPLKSLAEEFAPAGFRFVAIHSNADEELAFAQEHFRAAALPFPVLQDSGTTLADAFGAFKTPHVFVLDGRGRILFQGGVDDSHIAGQARNHFLREALVAIRDGREPAMREARSLGCIIKRP